MYVYAIFLSTLSSSLTSYFYVLLYLFLAISFVLALKLFVYYSLIAANIILVYIFGFVVISINFASSLMSFGLLTLSFYLYLFLSVYYSFLLVLFLIELFSSFFNSLTLTNRLSINIFVGSLLINLLSLLSSLAGVLILAVFFVYESLNLIFQSFIFLLLSFFYLSYQPNYHRKPLFNSVSQSDIRYKHELLSDPHLPTHIRIRLSLPISYYRLLFQLLHARGTTSHRRFRAFYHARIAYLGFLFKSSQQHPRFNPLAMANFSSLISRIYSAYLKQLVNL